MKKMEEKFEDIERRLARGLQFADNLSAINQMEIAENTTLLHSILELLVSKGLIRYHEIEERKKQVQEYFILKQAKKPQIRLVEAPDKYSYQADFQIDCTQRIHLCKGSCCRLWFALSKQDMDEGIVRWDYSNPYNIAHNESGYCVHNDCENKYNCKIYENRPFVCRSYDCRQDKRIWLDFENRIPNPEIEQETWPQGV